MMTRRTELFWPTGLPELGDAPKTKHFERPWEQFVEVMQILSGSGML